MMRVGWAKHNGCGEIIFRQAAGCTVGEVGADEYLADEGWTPLASEPEARRALTYRLAHLGAIRDCLRELQAEPDMTPNLFKAIDGIIAGMMDAEPALILMPSAQSTLAQHKRS